MDRIWAPWRKSYIRHTLKRAKGCLFCRLPREHKDPRNLILARNKSAYAILNLYPYNNGHILIIPYRHTDSLHQLSDHEKLDWLRLYDETIVALKRTLKPNGFNVGINLGRIAGAGIPKHIHLHIVPRWKGDINFMPVTANTKVVSESLRSVYDEVKHALISAQKGKRQGG